MSDAGCVVIAYGAIRRPSSSIKGEERSDLQLVWGRKRGLRSNPNEARTPKRRMRSNLHTVRKLSVRRSEQSDRCTNAKFTSGAICRRNEASSEDGRVKSAISTGRKTSKAEQFAEVVESQGSRAE